MFNFIVTVQEKPDGTVFTDTIDRTAFVDDSTPSERRVAEAIKQAVKMARVNRTRPSNDGASYIAAAQGVFSDLEWALGLAQMSTGGPGEE